MANCDNSRGGKTAEEIARWICRFIALAQGTEPQRINRHESFDRMGLDSMMAISLIGELELWLDASLGISLPYEYPTIALLSQRLAESSRAQPARPSVRQDTGS